MDTQHYAEPDAAAPVEPPPEATAEVATETATETIATRPAPSGGVTEIGPTLIIRGKLDSREDLVVHGRIEADITSTKSLEVRKSGIIKATVQVLSARIEGIVVGNVTADEKIEIAAAGRVVGDLYAPAIVIREGAAFRGNIDMPQFEGATASKTAPAARSAVEAAAEPTPDAGIPTANASSYGHGRSDKKRKKRR